MRFAFTDDQLRFRDAVRDALVRECTPAQVRGAWAHGDGRVPGLWPKLGELGLTGLLAGEAAGGLGLSVLDLVLPLEETGRVALPEPIVETAAVAIPLLEEVGSGALREAWLPRAVAGEATITAALGDGALVANADSAELLLLARGGALHAVPRADATLAAQPSVDGSRRLFVVEWSPRPGTVVADGTAAAAATARAFDRGALATAAQLIGLAARMLDLTVEYAKVREQFGKPIGSFQAVKHHLANALGALEMARPFVYRAAWSLTEGEPAASVQVSMAKARAAEAAHVVGRAALQVHGAIGYSFEYDLHLWMKRAWSLAAAWGDTACHRRRVAAAVLDGEHGWD